DPDTRLAQYVLLGVGGVRALRAMGLEPGALHLNEGHAALAPLELAAPGLIGGEALASALAAARAKTAFTPHTPGPAGKAPHPPGADRTGARGLRGGARSRAGRADRPGPHPPGRARRAVRRDPNRAATQPSRQRGQPPPRRGGAGHVEAAMARSSSQECAD